MNQIASYKFKQFLVSLAQLYTHRLTRRRSFYIRNVESAQKKKLWMTKKKPSPIYRQHVHAMCNIFIMHQMFWIVFLMKMSYRNSTEKIPEGEEKKTFQRSDDVLQTFLELFEWKKLSTSSKLFSAMLIICSWKLCNAITKKASYKRCQPRAALMLLACDVWWCHSWIERRYFLPLTPQAAVNASSLWYSGKYVYANTHAAVFYHGIQFHSDLMAQKKRGDSLHLYFFLGCSSSGSCWGRWCKWREKTLFQ